jgi:predicted DNA-binding transcriptional regulator AlpA
MSEPLLTPKEVAAKLRVSERRLGRWRIEGGGPVFVRLGHRTVVYAQDALSDWISGHTRRSTSDQIGRA